MALLHPIGNPQPGPPNPWTAPVAPPRADAYAEPGVVLPMTERPPLVTGPATPPGGVPAVPKLRRLPRMPASSTVGLYWVGAHGGAGVDTLSRLVIGSGTLGDAWPLVPHGAVPVVLVARTHHSGLTDLRDAIKDWAWRDEETGRPSLPGVALIGVALIRDTPDRKLPAELRDLARHVTAGVTEVGGELWNLPWVEPWRRGAQPSLNGAPPEYQQMTTDLHYMLPALRGGQYPIQQSGGFS